MRKVLILGGAGFVGSHLADSLLNQNYDVKVIDDLSVGKRKHLPKKHGKLTFIRASILDDIGDHFKDIDVVFHLAALTRPQESILDPINTTRVNVEGTVRVLQHAHQNKVKRVVYASTTSIYGSQKVLPINEKATPAPMSPYALTKLAGEQYCQLFYTMYGLEFNIIRPFNIYGSRQSINGGYSAAVPTFINLLKKDKTPWITGDGTQARDFIHVDDVVSMLISMSTSSIHGEAFNAGSGTNTTINEIYKSVARIMKKRIKPHYIPPVFEPKETLGDISKAHKLLGWQPKVTLQAGLKRTIEATLRESAG